MRRLAYAVGLMAMSAAAPAQAGVLLDTITGQTASSTPSRISIPGSMGSAGPTTFGGPLGISFTASYTTEITGVTVGLVDTVPNDSGSVMVYLVNDVANQPAHSGAGSSFALTSPTLLGTISDSQILSATVPTQGCSTLSTDAPLQKGIKALQSRGVSVLTEGTSLVST